MLFPSLSSLVHCCVGSDPRLGPFWSRWIEDVIEAVPLSESPKEQSVFDGLSREAWTSGVDFPIRGSPNVSPLTRDRHHR